MPGWKLLAVPVVALVAALSYLLYGMFLETSSSEQAAVTIATPSSTLPNTASPPLSPSPPVTAPSAVPTPDDAVLVGAGDVSSCTQNNDDRTANLLDSIVAATPGELVVFTAGDNAYEDGTLEEYQQCYDPTWGRHKARTRPAAGNHEYATGNADGYFSYFGAAAGDPGAGYYSYDLGAWHIVVLNTSDHCRLIPCEPGSPQESWLREDLAAHRNFCTLAIWHDPLFSSGRVHGSSQYAQPFWDALYASGADVVVNAHEHNYERFAPQTPAGVIDQEHGIREFIVGTGGESHYRAGPFLPNSEIGDGNSFGVLKLTLHAASYSWEFIPAVGKFQDGGSADCHGQPPG
ncbi:MAG: alkaline phosphatase [Chloroflexi bacterium]|nr:MAG: alkaline phosphatase [Chloroflexota bacterium]